MPVAIQADDIIARCLIYPQLFMGNIQASDKLWEFGQRAADGASHLSAVLKRLAPTNNDIHAFGCRLAKQQNDGLAERLKVEEPPQDKKRYYCGFKEAQVDKLCITSENYRIVITNVPEHGEDAHVDVALFISEGVAKNKFANLRTSAGAALAEAFAKAEPHRCAADEGDQQHPFERLGMECLNADLPGPWQGKTVRLNEEPTLQGVNLTEGFSNVFATTGLPVINSD